MSNGYIQSNVDILHANSSVILIAIADGMVNMRGRAFYICVVNDHVKRRYEIKELSIELKSKSSKLLCLETPQQQPHETGPVRTYKQNKYHAP